MTTPVHLKSHRNRDFHFHPQHALFALFGSFVLALLIVLILVPTAR
jgi:hypothetical protein